MNEQSSRVFGPIERGHFQLFATSNGEFYALLLEYLETKVFAFSADLMKKKELQSSIAEFIAQRKWQSQLEQDEDLSAENNHLHTAVYSRLLRCGWLIEHRVGLKTIVDLDSEARLFLQALLDIKNGKVRSFGGEVLQVKTLVESAIIDPDEKAQNIMAAGNHSRRFMTNLRAIIGAMRKIEQDMKGQSTVGGVINSFFVTYITDELISDFKKLRASNNPYRFRHQLVDRVQFLMEDQLKLNDLIRAYGRELNLEADVAEESILTDLNTISEVFLAVDLHLDMIEAANLRIERRIRNVARFLDRMGDDQTGQFIEAAKALGASSAASNEDLDIQCDLISFDRPVGPHSLHKARKKPRPAVPVIARKKQRDPALVMFEDAKRAYADRARVSEAKVRIYLERVLKDRDEQQGSEMEITNLDDFFVFERLPHLATQFPDGLEEYVITKEPGLVENEWITIPNFRVRRSKQTRTFKTTRIGEQS